MKKILSILTVTAAIFSATSVKAEEYFDGVYDKYQVIYSPSGKSFATGGMAEDRIVLTKRTTSGSGGYSEYLVNNKVVLSLGSNFEFVKGPKLIASHNSDLTFYNVAYNKGKFSEAKMSEKEVQELFPEAKIIKISEFKDGVFTLKKKPFQKLEVLLLNDTDKDFYKYSFEPSSVKKTDIAGLLEVDSFGDIVFSHYDEDNVQNPKYIIKVEFSLF